MIRYQKYTACVIRFISVALAVYGIGATLVALILMGKLWMLILHATLPLIVSGIILFLLAIPLAKLITIGINDD